MSGVVICATNHVWLRLYVEGHLPYCCCCLMFHNNKKVNKLSFSFVHAERYESKYNAQIVHWWQWKRKLCLFMYGSIYEIKTIHVLLLIRIKIDHLLINFPVIIHKNSTTYPPFMNVYKQNILQLLPWFSVESQLSNCRNSCLIGLGNYD